MRHIGTKTMITPRLTLRRLCTADAEQMYHNWAKDPAVTRFLRWPPHTDVEQSRTLLAEWEKCYADEEYYQWGIVRSADDTLMGSICVSPGEEDGTPEPGYCLGQAFWGQGYCTEALRAVTAYMFDAVGLTELHCCHACSNPASGCVMRKIGFVPTHESVYHKFDGTPVACLCYELKQENYDTGK